MYKGRSESCLIMWEFADCIKLISCFFRIVSKLSGPTLDFVFAGHYILAYGNYTDKWIARWYLFYHRHINYTTYKRIACRNVMKIKFVSVKFTSKPLIRCCHNIGIVFTRYLDLLISLCSSSVYWNFILFNIFLLFWLNENDINATV